MISKLQLVLSQRDLLSQISNNQTEIKSIYAGFDGTAQSLQIGNLTPIAALKHLAKVGIKPIVLLGGATSAIGDPSGKNSTRQQLSSDAIDLNINLIEVQIKKLLPEATIVNNTHWLSKLSFMDFLEKIANYIPVSYILNFKTFSDRLANHSPLTIKEILYPLMQGYDFLHLFETQQCHAQLGGHDQWCNVLTGVDLIQRKYSNNTAVVAVTSPLLVDSCGNKMGKSLQGAIYLSKEKSSVYDFWTFWRNIEDSLVKTCLLRFSDFSLQEIDSFITFDINEAKIRLADFITTWVHSKEESENAKTHAKNIFVDKNFDHLPLQVVSSKRLSDIVSTLKKVSISEAKRLIQSNSIKVNNQIISDVVHSISETPTLITIGKKDVFKVIWNN